MKKLFFLLPMLALFVACQPDNSVTESGYITFTNQQVENLTRGDNTITTANLANFDVWGHNDAGIVFNSTKVEKQGDVWTSAVQQVWKAFTTYHFHAFAPSGLISNVGEYPNSERIKGLSNFSYTNAGDKDLVYAYATRIQGSLLELNSDPVQLSFEHLLSRVQFTFNNSLSKGNITISNVQITEAIKSAELNCADASIANWSWAEESTGVYNFGATSSIAQGASALTENVQFLFPAATRNYNISFSIAYESEETESKTATITDVNFEMGKSYNITVVIEDKDIVTEQYGVNFFVAEVKEWGSNIEIDATLNEGVESPENPEIPEVSSGMENGYEWVDLGLPSGLKWATCNVGANSPEDYGDYFAWGEVEPKEYYVWETYKYGSDYDQLTKYCTDSDYGKDGFVDYNTILDPEDDAAAVNWGGSWRMPTIVEQQELINICIWDWITQNEVKGYKVTGPNGNSVFLPAAGFMDQDGLGGVGDEALYWSSSSHSSWSYAAYVHYFYSDIVINEEDIISSRCMGHLVRPVCP